MKNQKSKLNSGFAPTPEREARDSRRSAHTSRLVWGFTMIELLVAIALFSIVVSIAVGGLVNAIRIQRQIAALIAANSNASFALEQIARDVRTGSDFSGANCSGQQCSELDFMNAFGQATSYRLRSGKIEKGTNGAFQPVTGDNTAVQYLSFTLIGNLPGDGYPPRIIITLGVSPSSAAGGASGIISGIETTVSARQLDT